MKKIFKLVLLPMSVLAFILHSCTPPNTVNVTAENKGFNIKATSEIKVPRLPETYSNTNYYSGTILGYDTGVNYICGANSTCSSTGTPYRGYHQYIKIYIAQGFITASGVNLTFGKSNISTNKFELNKVYQLGLGEGASFDYYPGYRLQSGSTSMVFQKVSDSQVKLIMTMTGMRSKDYQSYTGWYNYYNYYFTMDSSSIEVNITVPNDTLKLDIPNNNIGKNASATNLVVDTSSTSRKWIMEIIGDGFSKTYSGTNDVTQVFPEGVNVKSLKDGDYVVQLYYEDQPSERLTQTITVDNGEDKVCSTKYTASGVPYDSCFSCPEGMNIVFVNGVPAQCEPNGEVPPEVYVKNGSQFYPFGNNGAFRINSFSENYCTTQENN